MEIDRRAFFAFLGGPAAVAAMSHEAKADALEHYMAFQLNQSKANEASKAGAKKFPTAAEIEAQIETRGNRRGVGNLFLSATGHVSKLPPMPEKPTLVDFFNLRFKATSNHVLQSANMAMKNHMSEEIILACLLHDTVQELIKVLALPREFSSSLNPFVKQKFDDLWRGAHASDAGPSDTG